MEKSTRPYYADPTANTAIGNVMRDEKRRADLDKYNSEYEKIMAKYDKRMDAIMKRVGERVFKEIFKAIRSLKESRNPDFKKKYVSVNDFAGFSVECDRMDDGHACYFQIYYQEGGIDVDCCTLIGFDDEADIKGFIRMWVK